MKLLFVISIVLLSIFVGQFVDAAKNLCSYDYCTEDELKQTGCRDASKMTREQCNNQGGLYITYRGGYLSGSNHKCCNFRMTDIPEKYLYCVRNIRSSSQLCTSEKINYRIKIKTKNDCNTLSCT